MKRIAETTAKEAKALRCPKCGARPGARCKGREGKRRQRPHDERIKAAWATRPPKSPKARNAVRVTYADGTEKIVKASAFKRFGPHDDRSVRGVE